MRNCYIKNLKENFSEYEIVGEEFHHLKNVLRIKKNEKIIGFNGKGLIGDLTIKEILKDKIIATVKNYKKKTYDYLISVGIPVIKQKNFNFILKSVQQLGVKNIFPLISEYSVVSEIDKKKILKWNKILIESAKQSGNFYLPLIEKIYQLEEIKNFVGERIVFYEKSDNFFSKVKLRTDNECLIIVGPEGGFSSEEIDFLKNNGFIDLKLKTNILRSETAVISVLSIIKFIKNEI